MVKKRPFVRNHVESDCLHLLYMVANKKTATPQTYSNLARSCGIPRITLWKLINKYGDILKAVAERNNYRFRIVNNEDCIIDVVYDGAVKNGG